MMLITVLVFSSVLISINLGIALDSSQLVGTAKVLDYFESCPDKPLPNPDVYLKYDIKIDDSEEEGDLLLLNGEVSLKKPLDETKTITSNYYAEIKKRGFWTQLPYTLVFNDTCEQFWSENQLWDSFKLGISEGKRTCPIKLGEVYKIKNAKLEGFLDDSEKSVQEGIYRITARFTVFFTDYVEDACLRFFVNYEKN